MDHVFVADIHIKLGQKNVPRDFQTSRVLELAKELNKHSDKTLIIGGDLLDVAKPSLDEVGLMYKFLEELEHEEIILIPGNHEMVTKTRDCFESIEEMLTKLNVTVIREFKTHKGIDYIPYNILKHKQWPSPQSKYAVTHVRGEIPPHVKPEIPLERFSQYEKVLAGDLHSQRNSQANLLYPGSPYSTSFHRGVSTASYGLILFNSETGEHKWEELFLPQLLRIGITNPEDAVPTDFHHTIYEIEGNVADLSKVENTELLSKKIAKDIVTPPTLDLSGSIEDELTMYFTKIHNMTDVSEVITLFKENIDDSY